MKIITTVGTSLISNNVETHKYLDSLGGYLFVDSANHDSRIKKLKNELDQLIKIDNEHLSAEITSILKIQNEMNTPCSVHLLVTDSILGPICAEYIKKYFARTSNDIEVIFNENLYIIEDLQVKNRDKFLKNGLTNFFTRIREIAGGYWDNIVINITGGYKGLIPYSTIIAQINKLPIYYIFQELKDSKVELIKIPPIPLIIDYDGLEKNSAIMNKLMTQGVKKKNLNYSFEKNYNSLLEFISIEGTEYVDLNPLGREIWQKYKERFFVFYAPDDINSEINKLTNIKKIIETKFHQKDQRESQTERKQNHDVFDDGNNSYRIYYFTEKEEIFIYKVFENHDKHEAYLRNVPCTRDLKNEIIEKSKIRRIKITKTI